MTELINLVSPESVQYIDLSSAFVICLQNNKVLVGHNNWRKQWEIPAGKRDLNEDSFKTAHREFYEETHQILNKIEFIKVAEIKDKATRFRAIFLGSIENLEPFIKNPDDEMDAIAFHTLEELNQMNFDSLDLQILESVLN